MKDRITGEVIYTTLQEKLEVSEHKNTVEAMVKLLEGKTYPQIKEVLDYVKMTIESRLKLD